MEQFHNWLVIYAPYAHWMIFGLILLAGLNLPFSLDALTITAALLAATVVPQNLYKLFVSVWLGAILSAYISYWLGRIVGNKLMRKPFFQKIINPESLKTMRRFYKDHGLFAMIVGRFIPFGARNCLFMSSGMSHTPFAAFIWQDFIACSIWATTCFSIYYSIGHNYDALMGHIRIVNLVIGALFLIAVTTFIIYKRKKAKKRFW